MTHRVLDLFAGAGGMSLGFRQTGEYAVAVAIENNPHARRTYAHNHPNTVILNDVHAVVDYDAFQREFGPFDVIIGGPPCQGFSNANRQNHHIVNQNNGLVKKYVEFILKLEPTAFVMENVTMLTSSTHRFYVSKEDEADVRAWDLSLRTDVMELFPGKCPLPDVTALLRNTESIRDLLIPQSVYEVLHKSAQYANRPEKRMKMIQKSSSRLWILMASLIGRPHRPTAYGKIEDDLLTEFLAYVKHPGPFDAIIGKLTEYCALQKMFRRTLELMDNGIIIHRLSVGASGIFAEVESYPVLEYIKRKLSPHYSIKDDILNAAQFGAPQLRDRYIMVGIQNKLINKILPQLLPEGDFAEDHYRTVKDAIGDLESLEPSFDLKTGPLSLPPLVDANPLATSLRDSTILENHVTTATGATALRRFAALRPGQNFHDLDPKLVRDTYTVPDRTQNTIYMRLNYLKPSGTVLNVRKSMWIHPVLDRAVSIREAARLQTFPDSFVFVGPKDAQYQQIGNAVPPVLAKAIAANLASVLFDISSDGIRGEASALGGHNETASVQSSDFEHVGASRNPSH